MSLNGRNGHNGTVSLRPANRLSRQRPTKRNARIDAVILGRLAQGKSLRSICKKRYLPCATTVIDWAGADKQFSEQYARAREIQAETLAEDILEISDTAVCRDTAAAAKVRVDARKWIAAKLLPKKYGERPAETHVTTATTNNFVMFSPERLREWQERKAIALAQ